MAGLRSKQSGKPAAPPYTNGGYIWDQELELSGGLTVGTKLNVNSTLVYNETAASLSPGTALGGVTSSTDTLRQHITLTGAGTIYVPAGIDGQIKHFILIGKNGASELGTATIYPTSGAGAASMVGGSAAALMMVGDTAQFLYTNSAWNFIGGNARVVLQGGVPKAY
jgi:hypothetical protein